MNKQRRAMAEAVGQFIQYWGFRKVHGQIWTLVYLSRTPISATEITRVLRISKAMASLGIHELLEYKLIELASPQGQRLKLYRANPDVMAVIHEVLRTREKPLLEDADHRLSQLRGLATDELDPTRLENLGEMIANAKTALELLLSLRDMRQLSDLSS